MPAEKDFECDQCGLTFFEDEDIEKEEVYFGMPDAQEATVSLVKLLEIVEPLRVRSLKERMWEMKPEPSGEHTGMVDSTGDTIIELEREGMMRLERAIAKQRKSDGYRDEKRQKESPFDRDKKSMPTEDDEYMFHIDVPLERSPDAVFCEHCYENVKENARERQLS